MQTIRWVSRRRRDVFISYRRKDGLWLARSLYYYLKGKGVDCFFDFEDIHTGKFDEKIGEEIDNASYFVSVLTPSALEEDPNGCNWFRLELEHALQTKPADRILPVHLRDFPCDFSVDPSEVIRENATINQHVLDDGAGFEASIDKAFSACPGIRSKIVNADDQVRLRKERKFRRKVLNLYRNEPDDGRRADKIRKLGMRYELSVADVEEIAEESCEQVGRERKQRAWIARHPVLVTMFIGICMALIAYAAMFVSPAFDASVRQHWASLSVKCRDFWKTIHAPPHAY